MNKIFYIRFLLLVIIFKSAFVFSQTPLTIAPNFDVLDARGNNQNLYSYLDDGKYVLIDFFFNECFSCQSHTIEINNAFFKFGCNTQDVMFLGINFNNTDGQVISYENQYSIYYPNVSGINGGGNEIIDTYQIEDYPTIILIAPDRSIIEQDIWPLTSMNIVDKLISYGLDTSSCPYPYLQINTPKNSQSFQIYPNPTKDWINISADMPQANLTLKLFDYTGRMVIDKQIDSFSKEKICLNHLQTGLYFLEIFHSGSIVYSEKIVRY